MRFRSSLPIFALHIQVSLTSQYDLCFFLVQAETGLCFNADTKSDHIPGEKRGENFCLSDDGDELLIWETQTVNLVDPRMFLLVGLGQSLLTSRDRPQITELRSGCSPVGRS